MSCTRRRHTSTECVEAFVAGIASCPDEEATKCSSLVCDLYALSVIEKDKAWYRRAPVPVH